jgi:hypothetical protein
MDQLENILADDKYWYKNGLWHREDDPAREYNSGKEYWYNGRPISVNTDKEFKKYLKLNIFI